MKTNTCKGCLNPVTSAGHTSVDSGATANQRAKMRMVRWICGIKLKEFQIRLMSRRGVRG